MPFYSGGSFHTTFTCATGTRQEIVTGIENALSANGWTVISGGGTADVVLESATPSGGQPIRLRVTDPGSGNCATCKIQSQSGSPESPAYWLLPGAGKVFNVWGCQYQAFIFTTGSTTIAREFFACGALYVPNWLRSSVTEALWANGNAGTDITTTLSQCIRNNLRSGTGSGGGQFIRWTGIVNGTMLDRTVNSNASVVADFTMNIVGPCATSGGAHRFHDNTAFEIDAWVAFGITGTADEAKYRGCMWDAAVISDTFAGGTSKTIDGQTMYALTDNANVSGTLFVM